MSAQIFDSYHQCRVSETHGTLIKQISNSHMPEKPSLPTIACGHMSCLFILRFMEYTATVLAYKNIESRVIICTRIHIRQKHRQVCKSGGAGMLFSVHMQIFGYSPLKIQCTAILLDMMGGFSPPCLHP